MRRTSAGGRSSDGTEDSPVDGPEGRMHQWSCSTREWERKGEEERREGRKATEETKEVNNEWRQRMKMILLLPMMMMMTTLLLPHPGIEWPVVVVVLLLPLSVTLPRPAATAPPHRRVG